MRLVFATHNEHKVTEVAAKLATYPAATISEVISIDSLASIGCYEDIPETQDTIVGNAIQKATHVGVQYKVSCFAEDTGLEVDALGGAPGVYTARYAGEARDAAANMAKVLTGLQAYPLPAQRQARFRTVIALYLYPHEASSAAPIIHTFEGIVEGSIAFTPTGNGGFGYDPIFIPTLEDETNERTFAELPLSIKNSISHRSRAVEKLLAFLSSATLA